MIRQFYSAQFGVFLITGGIAAMVNFGSRILYNQWTSYTTAIVLAYLTGMVTAFLLAKFFVFKESQQSTHRSVLFFCAVNAVAVLQTLIISLALRNYGLPWMGITTHAPALAHAVGIVVPVFTSYLGHKRWSFG